MWLKLCLLLIYIIALFILARLLEAIACYETGVISRRLLDPMTLSVLKLKALLDSRGVSYEGVVEKHELTDLVDRSGQVGEDEMELAATEVEEDGEETVFTSGSHFFEQVEDAKDSVWLLQIQSHPAASPLPLHTWKAIRKKVHRFGVRAGIFDCSMDVGYCHRKHWLTSRVVLALPQDFETKSNVAFFSYSGTMRESPLYNWVRDRLNSKVTPITSLPQFQTDWLSYQNQVLATEIRAVLFQDRHSIPMFFSALSVKFPGRVRFGLVLTNSPCGKEIAQEYGWINGSFDTNQANYMIKTPEQVIKYGRRVGENFSFSGMEKFLNSLYPCLNDLFVVSFVINNLVAWFELVVVGGGLFRRLRRAAWCWIQYNILFVMLWLPIMGVFQLPYLDQLPLFGLKLIRMMASTDFATLLRNDYTTFLKNLPMLFSSLALYSTLTAYLCHRYKLGDDTEDDEDFWNFAQMRTLQPLLRPSDTIIGPFSRFGSEFIMGEDIYDVPAAPTVDPSYIKELPTWQYHLLPMPHTPPSCLHLHHQCHSDARKKPMGDRCPCDRGPYDDLRSQNEESILMANRVQASNSSCTCMEESQKSHSLSNTAAVERLSSVHPCLCSSSSESFRQASRKGLSAPGLASPSSINSPKCPPSSDLGEKPICKCKAVLKVDHTECVQGVEGSTMPSGWPSQEATNGPGTSSLCGQLENDKGMPGAVEEGSGPVACFPDGFRPSTQCVICLEEYSPGVILCGLPCRHAFHKDCIERWLRSDNHLCPVCRWPTSPGHQCPSPHPHSE